MVAKRKRKYRPFTDVEIGVSFTEKGAVRVKFPERPADELLDDLKDAGFRFSRKTFAWAHKGTEENAEIAAAVWKAFEEGGGVE